MPSQGSNDGGGGGGGRRRNYYNDLNDLALQWTKTHHTSVSAGISSIVSTAIAFPLDSVKTRMQTYKYAGLVDCVQRTYKTEGLRGFFRGELPHMFSSFSSKMCLADLNSPCHPSQV